MYTGTRNGCYIHRIQSNLIWIDLGGFSFYYYNTWKEKMKQIRRRKRGMV